MKLFFSEANPSYSTYTFPYVVWAVPESTEDIPLLYGMGFLPSSSPKYYLTRSTRISLREFSTSYNNRRVLKKCGFIEFELIPSDKFQISLHEENLCLKCARHRFGQNVIDLPRLRRIFMSKNTTHIMRFFQGSSTVGLVTVNIYADIAHYNFAFYDIGMSDYSLGTFILTRFIDYCAGAGFKFLYMGTCYLQRYLYKTKFKGFEFFNGFEWSNNIEQLEFLIASTPSDTHLFESPIYLDKFGGPRFSEAKGQAGINF